MEATIKKARRMKLQEFDPKFKELYRILLELGWVIESGYKVNVEGEELQHYVDSVELKLTPLLDEDQEVKADKWIYESKPIWTNQQTCQRSQCGAVPLAPQVLEQPGTKSSTDVYCRRNGN